MWINNGKTLISQFLRGWLGNTVFWSLKNTIHRGDLNTFLRWLNIPGFFWQGDWIPMEWEIGMQHEIINAQVICYIWRWFSIHQSAHYMLLWCFKVEKQAGQIFEIRNLCQRGLKTSHHWLNHKGIQGSFVLSYSLRKQLEVDHKQDW